MNMAVYAIGIVRPALRERACAAGDTIGQVEVDHGQASCTTPMVRAYIDKALAQLAEREARREVKG